VSNSKDSICDRLGVSAQPPAEGSKLGVALGTSGFPINGLRHEVFDDANGWYVWCEEVLGEGDDFFSPLHVEHIHEYLPLIQSYLDLPPGYRFLLGDDGFEDVWFDQSLLEESP